MTEVVVFLWGIRRIDSRVERRNNMWNLEQHNKYIREGGKEGKVKKLKKIY